MAIVNPEMLIVASIFKLNKDGSGYEVLHSFGEAAGDFRSPLAGLVEGTDGYLYGTTFGAGSDELGTVFKLSKDGKGFRISQLRLENRALANAWIRAVQKIIDRFAARR